MIHVFRMASTLPGVSLVSRWPGIVNGCFGLTVVVPRYAGPLNQPCAPDSHCGAQKLLLKSSNLAFTCQITYLQASLILCEIMWWNRYLGTDTSAVETGHRPENLIGFFWDTKPRHYGPARGLCSTLKKTAISNKWQHSSSRTSIYSVNFSRSNILRWWSLDTYNQST